VNDRKTQPLVAAPQVFEESASSRGEAARIAELEPVVGKLTLQL
jgi:hypothetical protein